MIAIFIYCVFCYLYEIGFARAQYKEDKETFAIGSILLAPILMPLEFGSIMYYLLRK